MEENTLLEVKDLRVVYKTDEATVHAVNGISFTLGERETIGLVGETGAGKTTTALTLLRLLPERTGRVLGGEIRFRGENLLEKTIPEMRHVRGAEISIIFQDPMTALNPALTVGDQVLVKVTEIDEQGRLNLSRRDALIEVEGLTPENEIDDRPRRPRRDDHRRNDRRDAPRASNGFIPNLNKPRNHE